MNNGCYRIVFNRALGVLQVVSELATANTGGRSGPRRSLRPHRLAQACALLLATGLAAIAPTAHAATATGVAGGNGGAGSSGVSAGGAGGTGGAGSNAGGQGGGSTGWYSWTSGSVGSGPDGSGGGVGSPISWYDSRGGGGGGGGGIGGAGQTRGGYWGGYPAAPGGGISFSGVGGGGGGGSGSSAYGYYYSGNYRAGSGGGGGGGGGLAVGYSGGGSYANAGTISGGAGGAGGNSQSNYGGAGGGGGGGAGVVIDTVAGGSLSNSGTIVGGAGGAGGNGSGSSYWSRAGGGGAGGFGVVMNTTGSLTNAGAISGGAGGAAGVGGYNGYNNASAGQGGIGIAVTGGATIINSGTISGGLSGNGATRADAILFTGTGNTLQLQTGENIVGNLEVAALGQAAIAAQNGGLSLGSNIILGNATFLDLDATTAGLNLTGSITGNGVVDLIGSNTLGLGTVNVAAVRQDANNTAQLNGNVTTGYEQAFDGNVVLGADVTLRSTTSGDISVADVNGAHSLAIVTDGIATLGTLGQTTALTSLVVGAGGGTTVLDGNITTTNTQGFAERVTLGNDVSLTTLSVSGGSLGIVFGSTLDGAHALTVNTGGSFLLNNAVGSSTALTGLTVNSGGFTANDLHINGDLSVTTSTSGSISQGGAFFVSGTSTFDASGNGITLNNAGNDFVGAVSLAGGNTLVTQITDSNALTLGTLATGALTATSNGALDLGTGTIGGTLGATSNGGAISQTGALAVSGVSTIDAGSGSIDLTNAGNDFGGAVSLSGGDTQITDANDLTLGTLDTANLSVDSSGRLNLGSGLVDGNLSATNPFGVTVQSGALTVTGNTTLDAGLLALTNVGNDFVGSVDVTSASSVTINDRNDLTIGSLISGPNSDVRLVAGGTLTMPVGAIDVGTASLSLISNGGSLSTPGALSGANIQLVGHDGLFLGDDVTGTNVQLLSTNAAITQSAGVLTASTLTGGAGTGDVTLTNAGNAIGTITNFSGGNFSLVDSTALAITGSLWASGNIALDDASGIDVTGSITAGGSTTITSGTALNIGTGGTVGSIAGDVVDNGLLAFNHADNVTFADSISGTGTLQQVGTGTLTLDGDSTAFAGNTVVATGSLVVGSSAGNGAALGGDVQVDSGAILGGHGTIGGNVNVDGGAHLAPGNSIGTLTIGGDASFAQGSVLDYEFGAPGADFSTPGNGDSVLVGGNLTLDGAVLNVTDIGGMGPGLYNLFSYGGALVYTNGGLVFGTTPAGETLQIQNLTGAKQINLIDTTGMTLNFWNGNGLASATQMGGGDGTWSTTSMTWTDASGSATAAMQPQPGFAIFGGAPGTVTIDNVDGAVSATGLQFTSGGYTLQGDTLTLIGNGTNAPVIRVGDGSSAGAGYTATIDNVLAGSDGIAKTDAGTLVLTAANTFSGGLAIEGGTVSVSSDANLGDAANVVTLDGGMLQVTGTSFQSTARNLVLSSNGGGFDIADAANVFTVDQALDGSGAFVKAGAGTLVLTAANSFTGGTTIGAGTLQLGNGGTTGMIVGDIVDNGTLAFDRSDAVTFVGTISGTGGLQQQGAGTTILTADNSFTGGTTITDGTLQLGNGGTTGMIVGDVVDNGTLAFDRSDAVTFAGTISGTGGLQQQGAGTTILTANNSFTGGTTITDGTLQLGNGGTTGMIVGDVVDNGTLAFDRSDAVTFAGTISGTGAVRKQGDNTLVLDGASSAFAGSTDVQSGTLVVGSIAGNGAELGGDVQIDSGATLAGLGAIGGDVINDGLMSPGMGAGTFTIHGDYTQTADGSLAIDANPDGQADLVLVDGNASLDGSALILANDGNWNPQTDYTILTTGGIVTGTFGTTTSNLLFLDPILTYDAHDVYLSLQRNDVGFASAGVTPNQRATATGADTLGFGNAVYDAITTLDASTAPQAFDALSGEVHASVQTALVEDSRYLRGAMRNRLDTARADGNGVWAAGWGHWAHDDSDGNAAELRTDGNGLVAGADAAVGDSGRIGVVVGMGHAHARVDDRASRADIDSRHLGVYGRMTAGGLQLQAGAARSSQDVDTRREAVFTGFNETLRGSHGASTTQLYVDGSHDFTVSGGTLSPFVDLARVQVRSGGFTETGGDAALQVDPAHASRTFATAGVRGAFAFGNAWKLHGSLGWSHTLGGNANPQVSESFAAGSDAFVISGVPIAANSVSVEAGLGYQATPAFRIDANYIGQFASDARDQGANVTFAWSF